MIEKKKKICVVYLYPPHYRQNIFEKLDNSYDCTFVFGDEPFNIKKLDMERLNKVFLCHAPFWGKVQFQWGLLPFAFKQFDTYLLNVNTNNITTWLFFLILKLFKNKHVYLWIHGLYGKESKKQIMVRKWYYKLVDGLFLYGNYARDLLIKQGLNHQKLFVIHNSLDYEKQLLIRKEIRGSDVYVKHFGNFNPNLVMIGRLNDRKKMEMLFEAMTLLNKKGLIYNATVIGDGEYKGILENRVQALGIQEQVWFYGACYDEVTNATLLYNSDLCVIPGDVGLSAIHSMMFGVPVITHNFYPNQGPEFETILEGSTGSFYNYGDVCSLAKKIEQWFNQHNQDRDEIRANCYRVVDDGWTPEWQMNVFKNIL